MSDYISRKEAIKAIMGQPPDAHYPSWYAGIIEKVPAADVRENTRERQITSTKAIAILSDDLQHLLWAESSITEYKGWFLSNEQYEKNLSDLRDAIEAHKMAIRKLGGATV